jgi:hypothetical protein
MVVVIAFVRPGWRVCVVSNRCLWPCYLRNREPVKSLALLEDLLVPLTEEVVIANCKVASAMPSDIWSSAVLLRLAAVT